MKRADAQKAIDEAFADGLKHLFSVLVMNLEDQRPVVDPIKAFTKGVAFHDEAHAKASSVIEKIFPE